MKKMLMSVPVFVEQIWVVKIAQRVSTRPALTGALARQVGSVSIAHKGQMAVIAGRMSKFVVTGFASVNLAKEEAIFASANK